MLRYRPSFEFRPSVALPNATSQEYAVVLHRSRAAGVLYDSGRHRSLECEAAGEKLQSRLQSMLDVVRQANLGKEAVVPLQDFIQQIEHERDEAEASLELQAKSAVACFVELVVHALPDTTPGNYDTKATQTSTPVVHEFVDDLKKFASLKPPVQLYPRQQPEKLSRFDQADGLHPVLTQAIPGSIQHMSKDAQEKILTILNPQLQLSVPSEATRLVQVHKGGHDVQEIPSLAYSTSANPGLQTHKGNTSITSTSNENARAQKAAQIDPCPSIQTRSYNYGLPENDRTVVVKLPPNPLTMAQINPCQSFQTRSSDYGLSGDNPTVVVKLPPKAKSEVKGILRSKVRALNSSEFSGTSNEASPLQDAISGFWLGDTPVKPNSPKLTQAATNKQHDSQSKDPAKTTCMWRIPVMRSTKMVEEAGKAVLEGAKATTDGNGIVMPERAKETTNLLVEEDRGSVVSKRVQVRYQGPDRFLGLLDLIKKE